MKVEGTVNNRGHVTEVEKVLPDQIELLYAENQARISATVGRANDFGSQKVAFTVSITCPQSKSCMDKAAQLCFEAALEYANDAMSHIAPWLEELGKPETPPAAGAKKED